MNYYLVECALNKTINCLGKNYISLPIQDAGGGSMQGGEVMWEIGVFEGCFTTPTPLPF